MVVGFHVEQNYSVTHRRYPQTELVDRRDAISRQGTIHNQARLGPICVTAFPFEELATSQELTWPK